MMKDIYFPSHNIVITPKIYINCDYIERHNGFISCRQRAFSNDNCQTRTFERNVKSDIFFCWHVNPSEKRFLDISQMLLWDIGAVITKEMKRKKGWKELINPPRRSTQEMHKKLIFKLNEEENLGQVENGNFVINNLGYHVVRMCVNS